MMGILWMSTGLNLKSQAAGSIELINSLIQVYNLQVDEPCNYFAGGVLVNNGLK